MYRITNQELLDYLNRISKTKTDYEIRHELYSFYLVPATSIFVTSSLPEDVFDDIVLDCNFYRQVDEILANTDNVTTKIYLYSVIISATKNSAYTNRFAEEIIEWDLPFELKYFLQWQLGAKMFRYPIMKAKFEVLYKLTKSIYDLADSKLTKEYTFIPYEQRNHDFVVVIISQLLGYNHGPSQHELDHCYAIIKGMGKKLLLINTAEFSLGTYMTWFHQLMVPSYVKEYNDYKYYEYKDIKIPFFQCEYDMPNIPEIEMILDLIRNIKPEFVLEIGTGSIVAALCEKMVPVLTNGTMHNQIECSHTKYQTLARKPQKDELIFLEPLGIGENNIIESMFTTEVRPKSAIITRDVLKVPNDAFVIATVGTRLGLEITEDLLDIMADTVEINNKIYYVFFGEFDRFESVISKYDAVRNHFVYFGKTNDIISCLEQCNLYLNPYRIGGGMSSIEAMAVGLPAVSTSYGDGGVVVGEDFWVETVHDYKDKIIEYAADSDYYYAQANIALARGKYLQNSQEVFCDTIRLFLDRVARDEGRI